MEPNVSHTQADRRVNDEEDVAEAERDAEHQRAISNEVKKHLTQILIEVTDQLFGECRLQVWRGGMSLGLGARQK